MSETELKPASEGERALRHLASMPVEVAEKGMLEMEQAECPVIHRFGPGLYIRETYMPTGTVAIGHGHKHEHMNVILKGRLTVVNPDGSTVEIVAPASFVGTPGRKMAYFHEDTVWQNIYATTETDLGKLEEQFIEKTDQFYESEKARIALQRITKEADRLDFQEIDSPVLAQDDSGPRDYSEIAGVMIYESPIHGHGLFASFPFTDGQQIGPINIGGRKTIAGRFVNHSKTPNAKLAKLPDGSDWLVAISDIRGCSGGQSGDEITIDYRQDALPLEKQLCHG